MHPHDASPPPPVTGVPHHTNTIERGAFALARCTCGWSGPARRSRERARTDAAAHVSQAAAHGPNTVAHGPESVAHVSEQERPVPQ
ncbi:hypothetical protein RND61_24590 [Streptomyces sp. TRM76323]|uniref:Uncharacterized protein n=1 Tax=Streptomyces tamarix TaxID=3078565 RepID=A0ABU3QR11_9ACTN|nr:hypothetical protein [Streptomyces tamarix]MDT9685215.1 hypothetical protein [Streptomyces tamarix]